MYFPREVEHPRVTRQGFLALVVVIAETYPHLVGYGPFLDAADQKVRAFFQNKGRKFQRIGVVQNDGSLVGDFLEVFVIFFKAASWIKALNITSDDLDTNPWLLNVRNGGGG
jgi:hypothetical protein